MRLLPALLLPAVALAQRPVTVTDAMVQEVQRSALLIDTHNDAPTHALEGIDIASPKMGLDRQTDVERLRQGGVGAVFFSAYVAAKYAKDKTAAHRALDMIDAIRHDVVERHAADFQFATTADEIESAHRTGKIAALIGIEGGHAIEGDVRLLRDYYALGVRYMTLTHTNTNDLADSSGDLSDKTVKRNNGLSERGKQVVQEMNRLGMMVDISHVADKTFWDVIATSKAPVIASHSSCRALDNEPRNMTDEMIAALAKNGGVIQINFFCQFLSQKTSDSEHAKPPAERVKNMLPATLQDVVAHIDHAVKIAGIDHVGIGSDFDGIECAPTGLEDPSKFPNLTRALLEHGYTADQIRKIYGGNTLRLMRAVEQAGAKLRN
jgi:membrane dipeptidase